MRRTIGTIAVICLVLASCGDDDVTGSEPTTSAPVTTAASTTTTITTTSTATTEAVPAEPGELGLETGKILRLELGSEEPPIEYYAYLPSGHDGSTPLPLIIGLHGYTQSPSSTLGSFPTDLLDERGYAWLAPPATEKEDRNRQWAFITTLEQSVSEWPQNPPGGGTYHPFGDEDVLRVVEVLDDFSERVPIDQDRIYAWGYSGGAWMSIRLACDLADKLVAVGAGTSGVFLPEGCSPTRAVPIISFGTTEDAYHPADWTLDGAFLWAEQQACDLPVITEIDSGEHVVQETRYSGCLDGSEIVVLLVDGAIPGTWFYKDSPWSGDLAPPYDDPPSVFLDFFESHTG